MDNAEGKSWIQLAQKAEDRLRGLSRSQRSIEIKSISEEFAVSPNTTRRAIAAYRIVREEAPRYGVPLESVVASMSAIETLSRIARVSPDDAGVYYRSVLLGKTSYAGLRAHCESLESIAREEAKATLPLQLDIGALAKQLLHFKPATEAAAERTLVQHSDSIQLCCGGHTTFEFNQIPTIFLRPVPGAIPLRH